MIGDIEGVDKWFSQRWGKFTASELYKLLPAGDKGKLLSAGAYTYIKQKAMEMTTRMWERPALEEVKSLLHGKAHEYPAYEAYVNHTKNYSMRYLGTETPLFLEDEQLKGESGGSPDVINITSSNEIDAGAELKCPINPLYHFERLKWKTQWDVKEGYILCYTQIQKLLGISGAKIWQFVSYDDRQISKKNKQVIIDVYPDKKFQDNLYFRTVKAIEEKYRILDEHMNA